MCVFHQVQSHYFKLGMLQWLVSSSRLKYLNRITENFCTYIHAHQRINTIDFGDPLNVTLAPPTGQGFNLSNKIYILDVVLSNYTYICTIMVPSGFILTRGWIPLTLVISWIWPIRANYGSRFWVIQWNNHLIACCWISVVYSWFPVDDSLRFCWHHHMCC